MRILMIGFNQTGKGTYWRMYYFGRALAARGHDVTVMCTSPTARRRPVEHVNVGVHWVEMPDLLPGALRSGWDPWDVANRLAWLRNRRFDVVHAVESRPVVLIPALSARRHGARLIMDWCDWFGRGGSVEERPAAMRAVLRPAETFLEERFRTCADGTVTINAFLAERAVALGARPGTVTVIRNGCNPEIVPEGREGARRILSLPAAAPLVGYVGMIYTQDARFMAAALNCLRRRLPSVQLVRAGYFTRDIESWLDDPRAVVRSGPLPALAEVHRYLSACDVCWLPLRNSGANRGRWPGKLNDYMSLARPVVATAVGDLVEVVPQYGLGLVTPEDAEEFAGQTATLLLDRGRLTAMGQAARRAAEGDFLWERRTDDLEQFYRRILG